MVSTAMTGKKCKTKDVVDDADEEEKGNYERDTDTERVRNN